MSQSTFTTVIKGKTLVCDVNLTGFDIRKMASTNVDYYAINKASNNLFIQFLNGNCYVYSEVPKEVLELAESCDSIGKYFFKFIKGKYPDQQVANLCIRPLDEEEEDDEDDEFGNEDLDFENA